MNVNQDSSIISSSVAVAGPLPRAAARFFWRVSGLGALLLLELTALSIWIDGAALTQRNAFAASVGDWSQAGTRAGVVFAIVFLAFGYLKNREHWEPIRERFERVPFAYGCFAAHLGLLLAFSAFSYYLFHANLPNLAADVLLVFWMAAAASVVALALLALAPISLWAALLRDTGTLWLYALAAGVLSVLLGRAAESFWGIATDLTFRMVALLLQPFVTTPFIDAAHHDLGSRSFHVIIDKRCSGLEGAGLMLAFSSVWLWFFRRECRFPRALLLIPAGILVLWLANSVRITSLILIGNAGAPDVAVGGFHSQAGWIAFSLVALGFSIASRRVSWFSSVAPAQARAEEPAHNPAAPYLMPFLAILAASMISRASAASFEWLYPLRFLAAATAVWHFRESYRRMDWRVGWLGPPVGALVFFLWIGLDRVAGHAATDNGIAAGLASLPAWGRAAWLTCRVLAAVVTVPVAEELAFRGFFIRRWMRADFESLPARAFTWLGLAVSSVAFGLMHGDRWIAGTAAGLLYAATFLRRGRIGETVAAHATTNALLAAWVLAGDNWRFW